jgi:hypothetical protein
MLLPNPKEIDGYISEIVHKFKAPEDVVIEQVEQHFNRSLELATGYSIETWVEKTAGRWELKVWACNEPWYEAGTFRLLDLHALSKQAVRLVASRMLVAMRNFEVTQHYSVMESLVGRVFPGQIIRPTNETGELSVDVYYPTEFNIPAIVTGVCEKCYQVRAEQRRYRIGALMKWYVRKIELRKAGGELRLLPRLDRQTIRLPELLLRQYCNRLEDGRRLIKCRRRIPGAKSVVWTSAPIPKKILQMVQEEIHEYLEIKFLKTEK